MLPERFDLTYIDVDGHPKRPVAIHRAIFGSFERFVGILTEHFAGNLTFIFSIKIKNFWVFLQNFCKNNKNRGQNQTC